MIQHDVSPPNLKLFDGKFEQEAMKMVSSVSTMAFPVCARCCVRFVLHDMRPLLDDICSSARDDRYLKGRLAMRHRMGGRETYSATSAVAAASRAVLSILVLAGSGQVTRNLNSTRIRNVRCRSVGLD